MFGCCYGCVVRTSVWISRWVLAGLAADGAGSDLLGETRWAGTKRGLARLFWYLTRKAELCDGRKGNAESREELVLKDGDSSAKTPSAQACKLLSTQRVTCAFYVPSRREPRTKSREQRPAAFLLRHRADQHGGLGEILTHAFSVYSIPIRVQYLKMFMPPSESTYLIE